MTNYHSRITKYKMSHTNTIVTEKKDKTETDQLNHVTTRCGTGEHCSA